MIDRTNAERQAALRQREKDAGLVRVLVTIPEDRRDELRRIVESWRTNANVAGLDAGNQ
jgi:hypothetical protein